MGVKSITLTVPQGLGDVFWIYQLYSPKFDVINFTIGILGDPNDIQLRSVEWLYTLPKVGNVDWVKMSTQDYHKMIAYNGPLLTQDGVYACNYPLEQGKRLEEIGEVEWDVEPHFDRFTIPRRSKYVCLYVSGNAKMNHIEGQWQDYEWVESVSRFYKKYQLNWPLVIIGAEFDRDVAEDLYKEIPQACRLPDTPSKIKAPPLFGPMIGARPECVNTVLRYASFFMGYQSGLSVLADNFDTPQLMMYFEKLLPMMYSWCKPQNILTRFYADSFDRSPEQVIEGLKWKP